MRLKACRAPRQLELPFDNKVDFARLQRERMLFGSPLREITLAGKMTEVSKRSHRVAAEARAKGGRNFLQGKDEVGIVVWRQAWALLLDTPPPLPDGTLRKEHRPKAKTRSRGRVERAGKQPPPFRGRTLAKWRGNQDKIDNAQETEAGQPAPSGDQGSDRPVSQAQEIRGRLGLIFSKP